MSLKFRCKTESSNIKKNISKVPPQDFGLKGSNMQINIRLGSNRVYETGKPLAMSSCKSEDCLQTSLRRETLTTRKILSDRPATAGYGLAKRNPYSSMKRHVGSSSTSREDNSVPLRPKLLPRDWVQPNTSSQSWSSSVDSELATVGSFETDGSLDDKQSFAVFSSISCDSRENFVSGTAHQGIDTVFTGPIQQVGLSQSESTCRFASPSGEQHRDHDNEYSNMEGGEPDVSNQSESEVLDNVRLEYQPKNRHPVSNPFSFKSTEKNSTNGDANVQTFSQQHSQPSSRTETCIQNDKEVAFKTDNNRIFTIDSVDEVSSIGTPSANGEDEKPMKDQASPQIVNRNQVLENNEETRKPAQKTTKAEPNMLSEILNFLDDASHGTNNSPLPIVNSETESNAGGFGKPGCESVQKLHGMSMAQLTEEVLSLQMLVQDKDNKLVVLERALQHQRELLTRNVKTAKRELNLRCKSQKEEYEATLSRHVQFIQQLVEEKKALAVKCEAMASEMRQQTAKVEYERRISEERLNNEIRRLKQNLGKDQRHQQEKWLADRTEHIREATARGLEPELRRLMSQHQTELQSLRSIHQEELMRIEQAHLNKTVQQLNALREKMDNDREEACAKEREIMRAKYDKQLDEMETIHASKCQRLQAEMERERARWVEEESRLKLQEDDKIRRLDEKRRREKAAAQQLLQVEVETMKATHAEHVAQLRKKWDEDKNEEIAAIRHTLEMNFNERERRLQETQRRERDEDAEKFSTHFSNELKRQHEQWKALSEQQIQRIREKSAEEIKRLDQTETELRNKLTDIRRCLSDRDEELAALRLTLFQQVKENKDIKKTIEQYASERSDLRKVLQKELDDEFVKLNEEKRQLQEELIRLKSEHRLEINKKISEMTHMSSSHEQILGDIHEKVKQAVSKKDDALAQMQDRLKTAISRCQHLEELLDRQQRDLLARKK